MTEVLCGQFGDSYKPVLDGVTNVINNYAYWLNRKYCKCYVVTPWYPKYTDNEDFEVMRYFSVALPLRPPYRLGIPQIDLQLYVKLNKIPFKLVHAHSPFGAGTSALELARRLEIPIIATFHSKYYDDFKQALKNESLSRYLIKRVVKFYESVDSVWTVNSATAEDLREYGYDGPIEIVGNGTDFTVEPASKEDVLAFEKRLNLADDERVLLFVGQCVLQKNVSMIIQSIFCLKQLGVMQKTVFIGKGYAEDDMKQLAVQLGLEDDVIFLGEIRSRRLLKAAYQRADLFLFPSMYDNSPIVVKEAAAVAKPTLFVKGSNSAEDIIDGYNGFLCENDPVLFANRIKQILDDRALLSQVGENARNTVYRRWETVVDDVYGRYEDIVKTMSRTLKTLRTI